MPMEVRRRVGMGWDIHDRLLRGGKVICYFGRSLQVLALVVFGAFSGGYPGFCRLAFFSCDLLVLFF